MPWWKYRLALEGVQWEMEREAMLAGAEPQEQADEDFSQLPDY